MLKHNPRGAFSGTPLLETFSPYWPPYPIVERVQGSNPLLVLNTDYLRVVQLTFSSFPLTGFRALLSSAGVARSSLASGPPKLSCPPVLEHAVHTCILQTTRQLQRTVHGGVRGLIRETVRISDMKVHEGLG